MDELQEGKKSKRRRKGFSKIGRKSKGYWKATDDVGANVSGASTDTSAYISDISDTDTEKNILSCSRAVTDAHICSDSDVFSETATEFVSSGLDSSKECSVDQEVVKKKKRRKKKSLLAYRRKRSTKQIGFLNIQDGEDSDDDLTGHDRSNIGDGSDDVNVESSDNSSVDLSGLSDISLDSSLTDIDIEDFEEEGTANEVGDPPIPQSDQPGPMSSESVKPTPSSAQSEGPAQTSTQSETPVPPSAPSERLSLADASSYLDHLVSNLILLLPEDWSVKNDGQCIRVMKLNPSKNPAIEKSVYYEHKTNSIGIFVHGFPIPRDSNVFKCKIIPHKDNLGSVSDYICELITRIESAKLCAGIQEEKKFWDHSTGFVDYCSSLKSPCYRDADCSMLIKGRREICFSCQSSLKRIQREKERLRNSSASVNIDDKYLSKEELILKKNRYKDMAKKEKQRAKRLEKKLEKMKIRLDAAMNNELSSILTANQHKMSELQKTFWKSQGDALLKTDKRGMRWHPMLIRIALHLHSLSPGAYKFLNDIKVLSLPSERRLFDYSHFIEAREGCQKEITEEIRKKIEKCGTDDHFYYVNLMFDEMHIRSGLVLRRSTGELVGYTKLDDIDEELRKTQDELASKVYKPKLAKKVLVYMVRGITSHDVKDVVSVYTTDDLSVTQLYDRTWDVIYHLEEFGVKVLSLTCDGASVNRKFIFMHESLDKSCSYVYSTKNLAAGDSRPLYFILDPPHLLKTIRNALANSFSHKKTRKLWKDGQYLSWKVIEKVYELSKELNFPGHKLTKAHVKLTSFSCMTVALACQVLSRSFGQCILKFSTHEEMAGLDTEKLVEFIFLMNRFFDCLNGMEINEETDKDTVESNQEDQADLCPSDKAPYTDLEDGRFEFLEKIVLGYFDDWKSQISKRPGIYTEQERNKMIISHQALGALVITVKSTIGAIRYMINAGAPKVCARIFNQDPLEQYFSKVRRKQGDGNNPGAQAVLNTRLNLFAQGHVSVPSNKGNTQTDKRKDLEVDSTPLPTRKKPKS